MSLSQVAAFLNGTSGHIIHRGQINLPDALRGGDSYSMNMRPGFRIPPQQPNAQVSEVPSAQQYPFSHDIIEDETKVRIFVDAPGFRTDNMSFVFTEDGDPSLTIERTNDYPQNPNNIVNRRFGRYVITWPIHTRVQLLAHPHWSLENGVLTLEFEKRDDVRGVPLNITDLPIIPTIEVETGSDMEQVQEEQTGEVPELEADETVDEE